MKTALIKIVIGFLMFVVGLASTNSSYVSFFSFAIGYLVLGSDIIIKAFKNVLKRDVFNENLLMLIATIGAFVLGEYSEGVAVMLFYQVGELFSDYAIEKSKISIKKLLDIRPDYANIIVDGKPVKGSPKAVNIGDTIMIKPGERIPLDCTIRDGNSTIDNSALTGESMPVNVKSGSKLLSGSINLTGTIIAVATNKYEHSTASKILDLVQNATDKKAQTEKFITRFAKYYTPVIIIASLLIAIFPPLILSDSNFATWIYRALVFLVISCPCALVISIPLSFFCGIGLASKKGILIKGNNCIEGLATADTVAFDKTGTLTKGIFTLTKIVPVNISKDEFLEIASYAEIYSSHPIAKSIKDIFDKDLDENRVKNVENIAGEGIKAVIDNKIVCLGNAKFMQNSKILFNPIRYNGTVVYMSIDGRYVGHIIISDRIKDDALLGIQRLYKLGIEKIAMLTGDSKEIGESVANDLGLDYVATELLPEDKVKEINKLEKQIKNKGTLIFVGDGINDAPVIASADIGVAMGAVGSDAAIEIADAVIMDDKLSKIAEAIFISKFTMNIAKQNIVFSLGIKFVIILLAVLGLSSMWGAVFSDVGVSIIVILNSLRVLKK